MRYPHLVSPLVPLDNGVVRQAQSLGTIQPVLVAPAKAGAQEAPLADNVCMMPSIFWIPAYAGMTVVRSAVYSQALRTALRASGPVRGRVDLVLFLLPLVPEHHDYSGRHDAHHVTHYPQ